MADRTDVRPRISLTGAAGERVVWVDVPGKRPRHVGRLHRRGSPPRWWTDERLRAFLAPPWTADGWRTLRLARMYINSALTEGDLVLPDD